LNVHYHVVVTDGVFTDGGDRAVFHHLPRPSPGDLDTIALNVEMRVMAWLCRRGLLTEVEGDAAGHERSALDACIEGSLGLGELTALSTTGGALDDEALPVPTKSARRAGRSRGFDVHGGVVISESDHEGRERLLRYCARPALSLERLSRLPDGRIAYALRKPWGKQTHRVMPPTAFLARLAALVPPPRHPLVRFHGVFAPHSAWRKKVVPATAVARSGCAVAPAGKGSSPDDHPGGKSRSAPRREGHGTNAAVLQRSESVSTATDAAADSAHREVRSSFARIDWAALLKRIYDVDALACPCGGRLRFISLILEENVARAILDSLGQPSAPPPIARARSPDPRDALPPDE
jgi:hypothetical protein